MKDSKDDKVGYCKPPKKNRFKKGESGNPSGRPKKQMSFQEALRNELNREIKSVELGKHQTITKQELIIKQVVNNAAKGKRWGAKLIFNYSNIVGEVQPTPEEMPIIINMPYGYEYIQEKFDFIMANKAKLKRAGIDFDSLSPDLLLNEEIEKEHEFLAKQENIIE